LELSTRDLRVLQPWRLRQNEAEFICDVIVQSLKGRSSFVVSFSP
jgi:hypothetical protein